MKIIFSIACILILFFQTEAQPLLFPYLRGDKYGLADANGKLIVQLQFETAVISRDHPFILVKKNGLWGLMNQRGKFIVPCKMKESAARDRYARPTIPTIQKIMRTPYSEEYPQFYKAQLYQVNDSDAGGIYFVNPFVMVDSLILFRDIKKEDGRSDRISVPEPIFNGCLKVMTMDKMINFIDTSGHLVLKEGISNGDIINLHVYAIQNDTNKIALYHTEKGPLTDFIYDQVDVSSEHQFIIASHISKKSYSSYYSLFDIDGKLLIKDIPNEIKAKGPYAFVNTSASGEIVNTKGEIIAEIPKAYLSFDYSYQHLSYYNLNGMKGLIDSQGKIQLPAIYDFLKVNKDSSVFFALKGAVGLLNKKLEKVFEVDSLTRISYLFEDKNNYLTTREVNYKSLYGVVDHTGKEILRPVYTQIKYHPLSQVLEVSKDSLTGLFSLDGKMLLPFSTDGISVVDDKGMVNIYNAEAPKQFFVKNNEIRNHAWQSSRSVIDVNGIKYIANTKSEPVIATNYKELDLVEACKLLSPLFLARNPSMGSWYDVLDRNGKMILPEGYGVHEKVDNYSFSISGLVVVTNKQDINAITDFRNNSTYRSGVIDAHGNWVIKPDYLNIEVFGRKFIFVLDLKEKKHSYYTHDGKLFITNDYWKVLTLQHGDLDMGMLLVTQPEDKAAQLAFINKVENATSEQQLNHLVDTNLPVMKQGAVNMEGDLVVPFDYIEMDPFRFTYTTAKRRDKRGNITSDVVDWKGKIILRTKYPELDFIGFDSTYLKFLDPDNSLLGIMDLQGNVLVKPVYKQIEDFYRIAFSLQDAEKIFLVFKNNMTTPIEIGNAPGGRTSRYPFENGFFTTVENKDRNTFRFFDKEEKPLHKFEGFSIDAYNYGIPLPEGMAILQKTATSKSCFVNYYTGKEYCDEN